MSLLTALREWSERRHRRAVLRRIAKLDAQIEATASRLEEMHSHHRMLSTISRGDIEHMSALAGKVAYLKRIRAHNFQHEDVL
jgi:hypothetical protein